MRVRYIDEWERARQEQNTLSCKKSEKELEDIIKKYRFEIEKEIRIHTEIETFISENLLVYFHLHYFLQTRYSKHKSFT